MPERTSLVLAALIAATAACSREARLPTAVSTPARDPAAVHQDRDALGADAPDDARTGHRGRRRLGWLVAEAKDAMEAVLTGEQVYYQVFATYTDAADTAEIRAKLRVHLDEPSRRWSFSVTGASLTGFVARARGRDGTRAEDVIVTLDYERGRPPAWSVEKRGRARRWFDSRRPRPAGGP